MNRFRTKRRVKDDAGGGGQDSEPSSVPSFKSFRKGRKAHGGEAKKELDLAAVLPPAEDFRTSLLMTNLSARFSMLREHDDPKTKIGKASDDSVLILKRQSRLNDLNFGGARGLANIAELEPFREAGLLARVDSFGSDSTDTAKHGNIMDRAKPAEGNNLFGGRQKSGRVPAPILFKHTVNKFGKAVNDDALSSFQNWRQAEKGPESTEFETKMKGGETEDDNEPAGADSPIGLGYNRKRETSSTTSSVSALGRNSTAATSITSQQAASVQEGQLASTAPTSDSSTPAPERNATRTRRLYDQALSLELQEQQTSALTRIDTLARPRQWGSRTPDLGAPSPSPTSATFGDRFGDRRPMLTKASAPNLRTISPTTIASPISTTDLVSKVLGPVDGKPGFGGTPPLSPPLSEAGEHAILAIQPNDRGKATALGVFQKPAKPYDETRYAQRQRQLQQGRETPTQRARAKSNTSFATRSSRSSSLRGQPLDGKRDIKTEPPIHEHIHEHSAVTALLEDADDYCAEFASAAIGAVAFPHVPQGRAAKIHAALHESAIPQSLSLRVGSREEQRTSPDKGAVSSHFGPFLYGDSPTLGPMPGPLPGLSGLIRQHMRSDSNTSSVYGSSGPHTAEFDSRFPADGIHSMDGLGPRSNPRSKRDWYRNEEISLEHLRDLERQRDQIKASAATVENNTDHEGGGGKDDFASQLADARRRVREKLTSFVESDSSRAASPVQESPKIFMAQLGPNTLGIGVAKPKSSRGSLIDRSKTLVGSQSKAMKMLGLAAPNSNIASPNNSELTLDEKEEPDHFGFDFGHVANGDETAMKTRYMSRPPARRQQYNNGSHRERDRRHLAASRDRASPVRRPSDHVLCEGTRAVSLSRPDQSSHEAERGPSEPYHGPHSPMEPGTEIKIWPTAYTNRALSPAPSSRTTHLTDIGQPSRISPEAPPFGYSSSTPSLTCSRRPSLPQLCIEGSVRSESMKRGVGRSDTSQPTFFLSTSCVPTGQHGQGHSSPEGHGVGQFCGRARSRSGSGSRATANPAVAPPLPPINPRRRYVESRTRAAIDTLMSRKGERTGDLTNKSEGLDNENIVSLGEAGAWPDARKRFQNIQAEAQALKARAAQNHGMISGNSPALARITSGPPARRTVVMGAMGHDSAGGII